MTSEADRKVQELRDRYYNEGMAFEAAERLAASIIEIEYRIEDLEAEILRRRRANLDGKVSTLRQ